MDVRKGAELFIKLMLEHLDEDGHIHLGDDIDHLAFALADNENLFEDFKEALENHLETYGEDYGL
ncbi:hypothetical protein [Priestia megaterium]|uniref:hypothetical protein n=1 Tax=Priestia megaterium TaxID=1404 RepID=UPI000CA35A63|nr:hypothetical protein [Priestia megaterium]AUO14758.1 hypothetical protein C0569_26080 [Priestia megaterium]